MMDTSGGKFIKCRRLSVGCEKTNRQPLTYDMYGQFMDYRYSFIFFAIQRLWSKGFLPFYMRLLAKINIVILQPAKNLIFFFSSQKINRGDPSDLRPQGDKKGKLTKILQVVSYLKSLMLI
jgi:hypothetical protein